MSEHIRRITFSPLEINILLNLKDGEKNIANLREKMDSLETSILHALKALENEKLVSKKEKFYQLTNIGKIYALNFDQLVKASTLRNEDFWLQHDLSDIPSHLQLRLGELSFCNIVRADLIDLKGWQKPFMKELQKASHIKGMSPFYHEEFAAALIDALRKKAHVDIVLTPTVLHEVAGIKLRSLLTYLRNAFINHRLRIYLKDNFKVALTVTEKFFSLGLFNLDGTYDANVDIQSSEPQAIEWGKELFAHHLKNAETVNFIKVLKM